MLMSMTGYGRGCSQTGDRTYSVEMKSVNQRYFDIYIRVSKRFSFLEEKVRAYVNKHISRGKVDVFINIESHSDEGKSVVLDEGIVKAYLNSLNLLKDTYQLKGDITLDLIANLPDIMKVEILEEDEEKVWNDIKPAIDDALESLIDMRASEGIELKKSLLEYCEIITENLTEIEVRAPEMVGLYKKRLEERLAEFASQVAVDEHRIAMEVAIYADKCNIDEEIVRLHSHLKQMNIFLDSQEPVGRKLDFLLQEINREVNTIASKSVDLQITTAVVEIKGQVEKIREQIQNIE